ERPLSIAAGPDGNMWFTTGGSLSDASKSPRVGRITTSVTSPFPGTITLLDAQAGSYNAVFGSDGNLWIGGGNGIGKVTTTGQYTGFFSLGTDIGYPDLGLPRGEGLIATPGGSLWFGDAHGHLDKLSFVGPAW